MTAYLVHYVDFVKDVRVLKFAGPQQAEIYGFEKLPPDRTAKVVEDEDSFRDFSTNLLVAIYNALSPEKPVSKFETRAAAARRTFAIIYAKFNQLEVTDVSADPAPASTVTEETTTMPKDAAAKKTRASKGSSKAAGFAADFKQTRAGTDRAKVLALMDGTLTPEEIAAKMGGRFDAKYVMAHAYCLRRDCGIGYDTTKEGKLVAVYPARRSFADAIKGPTEKKHKPAEVANDEAELDAA